MSTTPAHADASVSRILFGGRSGPLGVGTATRAAGSATTAAAQ
jgi:hypothetical protein